MSNNSRWESPDIEGMLRERDAAGAETLLPSADGPFGISPSFPTSPPNLPNPSGSDGQYVIDPDYAEVLGIPFDAPFGYRR